MGRHGWILMLAALAGSAPAQLTGPTQEEENAQRERAQSLPNTPGTGPYPAVMLTEAAFPDHVLYRPANLAALGRKKLGVLVWGNGACRADGASARQHLLEIASHAYLVIAPGKVRSGPTATERPAERPRDMAGTPTPDETSAEDVVAGIDWALAENRRRGSPLHGRIDPAAIAIAGHSCGGLQALRGAADKRVRTAMIHNSGVYNDGMNRRSGIRLTKDDLRWLHTPVVYFSGGPTDIAYANGADDFRRIDHVPAMWLSLPVGHGGTFSVPNGGAVAAASVDWLEWQLRGDKVAARTFIGANCRLCGSREWTIERKGF